MLHGAQVDDQTEVTATVPEDDIVYVVVKEIPLIPDPNLANIRPGYYREMNLIGHSLETGVASYHGVNYKVGDRGTGVTKFVMSRGEKGNSGTMLYLVQDSSTKPAAAGLLFGLDEEFVGAAEVNMTRRGVGPTCPKGDIFTNCKVLPKQPDLEVTNLMQLWAMIGKRKKSRRLWLK